MPIVDPIEWAAFRLLTRRLGWLRALRVGMGVRAALGRGEPFAHLPPAMTEAEIGSRAQAAPAIVLYRQLRGRVGPERAVGITTEAVEAGALVFLRQSIGVLDRATLEAMTPDARRAFVEERGAKFPNARLRWDQVDLEAVRFTVLDCRFVSLCAQAGHAELAPMFCKGDARFFGTVEPGVRLIRPETLAAGGRSCRFTLEWSQDDDAAE